jgi:hypothetical protein
LTSELERRHPSEIRPSAAVWDRDGVLATPDEPDVEVIECPVVTDLEEESVGGRTAKDSGIMKT